MRKTISFQRAVPYPYGVKKPIVIFLGAAVFVALVFGGCLSSRAGYESAPYHIVRSVGGFELRDYPALKVVETPMDGRTGDGSFGRLFGFISGRNADGKKIAMTTPVFLSGNQTARTMAFVLPAEYASAPVPGPGDQAVAVRELPACRFAVLRFSGPRNSTKEEEALLLLKNWMAAENLPVLGAPVYAYFDPPWTPGALRRNEVMVPTGSGR